MAHGVRIGESIGGLASLKFSCTHVLACNSEYPHHRDAKINSPHVTVIMPFVHYRNKKSLSELNRKESNMLKSLALFKKLELNNYKRKRVA